MDPIQQIIRNVGQVTPLASEWEFLFRTLCENLEIKAYKYYEHKTEKRIITSAVKLQSLINRFENEFPKCLQSFVVAQEIRNALLHGNFVEVSYLLKCHSGASLDSTAIQASFKDGELINLGEELSGDQVKELHPIGGLLMAVNEESVASLHQIFEASIAEVRDLQELRAYSSNSINVFNIFFSEGRKLTESELQSFKDDWKIMFDFKKIDINSFLESFEKYMV